MLCEHKGIWPPTPLEWAGSVVVLIMAGLFMSGGLGGGAMMVPILIYMFRFGPKPAIYNAYAIICGGAIGNFWYSLYEKDTETKKP